MPAVDQLEAHNPKIDKEMEARMARDLFHLKW
jgi:hypothetical protein